MSGPCSGSMTHKLQLDHLLRCECTTSEPRGEIENSNYLFIYLFLGEKEATDFIIL